MLPKGVNATSYLSGSDVTPLASGLLPLIGAFVPLELCAFGPDNFLSRMICAAFRQFQYLRKAYINTYEIGRDFIGQQPVKRL